MHIHFFTSPKATPNYKPLHLTLQKCSPVQDNPKETQSPFANFILKHKKIFAPSPAKSAGRIVRHQHRFNSIDLAQPESLRDEESVKPMNRNDMKIPSNRNTPSFTNLPPVTANASSTSTTRISAKSALSRIMKRTSLKECILRSDCTNKFHTMNKSLENDKDTNAIDLISAIESTPEEGFVTFCKHNKVFGGGFINKPQKQEKKLRKKVCFADNVKKYI